jgi:predicted RNA methylase
MSNSIQHKIQSIATVLCKEELNFSELRDSIQRYQEVLNGIVEIKKDDDSSRTDLFFTNGKAIGTRWAADCLQDAIRTKMFVKGITEAIEELKGKGAEPIHILYAGTGPFATLILPILASYSPQEVKCSLLEINPQSFEYMKNVIAKCGFEDHVVTFIQGDATQLRLKNANQIDVLVSETMQRGLESEQQVPIVMNLLNQLHEDVVLIPEKIELTACQLSADKLATAETESSYCQRLDKVFELSKEALNTTSHSVNEQGEIHFEVTRIKTNPEFVEQFDELYVLTEIQVFQNTWIRSLESGLTVPQMFFQLPKENAKIRTFDVHYVVNNIPKLRFKEVGL